MMAWLMVVGQDGSMERVTWLGSVSRGDKVLNLIPHTYPCATRTQKTSTMILFDDGFETFVLNLE